MSAKQKDLFTVPCPRCCGPGAIEKRPGWLFFAVELAKGGSYRRSAESQPEAAGRSDLWGRFVYQLCPLCYGSGVRDRPRLPRPTQWPWRQVTWDRAGKEKVGVFKGFRTL